MADLWDFLFGGGALKQAAGTTGPQPSQAPPPMSRGNAGLDIAKMAQDTADQQLKKKKKPAPALPSSTMPKNLMTQQPVESD